MNPDTCSRGGSIIIRIRVDAETFLSEKKSLRIQKYSDTCGRGFINKGEQIRCYLQRYQVLLNDWTLLTTTEVFWRQLGLFM